ncbi:MAG: aspartate aminotransferase family protein [Planctomycetes bacterium]|nr:aspartate aminotransferase family protein [Planctomycetota bacterium]
MYWEALDQATILAEVNARLAENASYGRDEVLGLPGSFLDRKVFPDDAPFLDSSPYLRCLLENPNHIGCHTLVQGENAFAGTQQLEREVLRLCAEEILGAAAGTTDGYVASGGTEANLQALWAWRNELQATQGVTAAEIAVLHSEDTHYSVVKGCGLLGMRRESVPVDPKTRAVSEQAASAALAAVVAAGARSVIWFLNMGTTLFGSVDDYEPIRRALQATGLPYRVHVDAAFGGFLYPFVREDNPLSFAEPDIGSITLDAHKMLQAPYGTGIFLARKGLIQHVETHEASYVPGHDYTLCGSRSGANAVAVWMILRTYGSEGGRTFVRGLLERTDHLCRGLDALGLSYFRDPHMNVVAIAAEGFPREVAERFNLVPDTHEGAPAWWKIVVMDHVDLPLLDRFLAALA